MFHGSNRREAQDPNLLQNVIDVQATDFAFAVIRDICVCKVSLIGPPAIVLLARGPEHLQLLNAWFVIVEKHSLACEALPELGDNVARQQQTCMGLTAKMHVGITESCCFILHSQLWLI